MGVCGKGSFHFYELSLTNGFDLFSFWYWINLDSNSLLGGVIFFGFGVAGIVLTGIKKVLILLCLFKRKDIYSHLPVAFCFYKGNDLRIIPLKATSSNLFTF